MKVILDAAMQRIYDALDEFKRRCLLDITARSR